VLTAYEEMADSDPVRWRRVDADRPPDEVHLEVLAAVQAMRAVRA
jgi:thymidylate kinase